MKPGCLIQLEIFDSVSVMRLYEIVLTSRTLKLDFS